MGPRGGKKAAKKAVSGSKMAETKTPAEALVSRGKPTHHSEETHHSIERDHRGREKHVVNIHKHERYEYPKKPQTAVGAILARRGY